MSKIIEDMRDLFFIVKGQYRRLEPSFVSRVSNDKCYIGGYDPRNTNTSEWYMLLDKKTFHCVACGGDFNKVLESVYKVIVTFKGHPKNYFKHVSDITSDDYYEVTYLGHAPLTHEQRVTKAEGRCPRVSPAMREMYSKVFEEYGDFFAEKVHEMEEKAYEHLKEVNTTPKVRTKLTKVKGVTQHKEVEVQKETPKTPPKMIKVRKGIKRL